MEFHFGNTPRSVGNDEKRREKISFRTIITAVPAYCRLQHIFYNVFGIRVCHITSGQYDNSVARQRNVGQPVKTGGGGSQVTLHVSSFHNKQAWVVASVVIVRIAISRRHSSLASSSTCVVSAMLFHEP